LIDKALDKFNKQNVDKNGNYHPIIWKGQQLANKGFAFYLCGKFGREVM